MRAKKTAFWLLLREANPDIIVGCETWLHSGFHEREVLPSGYHFVSRRDRPNSHYGGVMIAAKDNITGTDLGIKSTVETCAARFDCPGKQPLIICSLYRPPNSDLQYMEEMCKVITELHKTNQKATIWIAGDANLPDIDWKTNTIPRSQYSRSISQLLLDTVSDIGSEQVVNFPTRDNNTLDLFITNRPSLVEKVKAVPGVSDHDIVFIQAYCSAPRTKPVRRKILLWKQVDLDKTRTAIKDFTNSFTSNFNSNTSINTLWDTFKNFCTKTIDDFVPSKLSTQRFHQPWITGKIKRLSRRKKRAYRKARKTGNLEDKQRYKQLQKESQHECRRTYNTYVRNTVSDGRDAKKLYSFIKSKRCDSSGVSPLKNEGFLCNDPSTKAKLLNQQFTSVFTNDLPGELPRVKGDPFPSMDIFTIQEEGVHKLLRNLNPHKASGPDAIPTRFLKEFASELAPALTLIFEASLSQASVPPDWNQALVTPIFKKGDRSNPANYRPISLTSVCCKVMEHIIHSQIMRHLDRHSILSDAQHGFRKKRSCETQLLQTLKDLSQALEDGEQIDAILLDFSKAFDMVPHRRLAVKLQHYGIHGPILGWVNSFLANRSQQVLVEGHQSSNTPVTSGVPQGSVLGPLLFLLYINDMPAEAKSTTRLFADDSLLYRTIRSTEDSQILQEDLQALQKWEETWQMSFNPTKCEVLRITKKRNPIKATYQIHGHTLTLAKTGKYLGVTLSHDMSWTPHIDSKTKAANNSLAFLRRNLPSCPQDIKAQCYKTLVRPTLEYASTAWDPHTQANIKQLETVQRRAARFITGDYRTTSSTSQMISKLGLETLQLRRQHAKLTMMFRITHGLVDIPADKYLRHTQSCTRSHGCNNSDVIRFWVPYCRTDIYRNSFFISGPRLWNQLPHQLATVATLEQLRAGLTSVGPLTC